MSEPEIIWDLFVELRKELLQSQRIRTQITGFKITFISAAIGILVSSFDVSNQNSFDKILFVIPAFSAILLDLIICGYSFSIKRIGWYIREYIEPKLVEKHHFTTGDFMFWEKYLSFYKLAIYGNVAILGNLGLTILTVVFALFYPSRNHISVSINRTLFVFVVFDIFAYLIPVLFPVFMKKKGRIILF